MAIHTMWIQIHRNGHYALMVDLRDNGPHLIPGSNIPLKQSYLGIKAIDYVLTVLQVTFANVFDGSSPGLSLFAFQFSGTLLAAIVMVWVENSKARGPSWKPFMWCLAMQILGFGVVMPLYFILQLLSQTTRQAEPKPNSSDALQHIASRLSVLPFSITIAYILPTIQMCIGGYHPQTHQNLVAVWQAFPLWLWGIQSLFVSHDVLIPGHTRPTSEDQTRKVALKETWTVLRRIYLFGIYLAIFIHIETLALVVASKCFPSLFMQTSLKPFAPSHVFVPQGFISPGQVGSIAEGMHVFLKYDCYMGSAAMLLWASYLHSNLKRENNQVISWQRSIAEVIAIGVLCGPGAAMLFVMMKRDRVDFQRQSLKHC